MNLQTRLLLDNLRWTILDIREYLNSDTDILSEDLNRMEKHLKLLETELRRKP
jgi:hypothetical protein